MHRALCLCLGLIAMTSGASEPPPATSNKPTAREVMDCCWPEAGVSAQRVSLKIISEGNRVRDVFFETQGGAPNHVARCLREVAFTFPWPQRIPEALEVTPPAARPSGWLYLAQIAALNGGTSGDRGILDPAPLVRACSERGQIRPGLRFRVRTRPVSVEPFVEMSPTNRPHERYAAPAVVQSDAERCVEAVMASTLYPLPHIFEFDFSDLSRAPAPAAAGEVAYYFTPENGREASGILEGSRIREALAERRPAVAGCWESALARRSELSGARRLEVHLRTTGRVASAQILPADEGPEVIDYLFDRCLVLAIEQAKFANAAGGAKFAYTWIFGRKHE